MITISTTAMQGHEMLAFAALLQAQKDTRTHIELFFDTLPFLRGKYYQPYLKDFIADRRLGMHCPIKGCDLLAQQGSGLLAYTLDRHKECLALAAELEIPYWVLHTNGHEQITAENRSEKQKRLVERLLLLTETAKQYGCETWVENVGFAHENTLAVDFEAYTALILEHTEFYGLLDIGHAHINGWDIPALIEKLAQRLRGFHLHDNTGREDSHAPIGEGTVQWEPILNAMKPLCGCTEMILEYQTGIPAEKIMAGMAWLRKHSNA